MYLLVKFYDDVYYVCPTSNIYNSKNRNTKAKYSDGFRYPANVIAKHSKKNMSLYSNMLFLHIIYNMFIFKYINHTHSEK